MSKNIYIKKTNGESELFDRNKLKSSLERAGASAVLSNEILEKVELKLKDGTTTSSIYNKAHAILQKEERKTAMRYALRRSVLALGPTGFPFEKYVAQILDKKGYTTKTGVMLTGECIDHEIDVVAYDQDDFLLVEVKFHNNLGIKSDTKTVLYVKARFDDLRNQVHSIGGNDRKMTDGLIVTNTKFTSNAKKYAKCTNLGVISWDYPEKGNLYDMIESTQTYPLTSVTTLSDKEKSKLISNGVLKCNQIDESINLLKELGISEKKVNRVIREVREICSEKN